MHFNRIVSTLLNHNGQHYHTPVKQSYIAMKLHYFKSSYYCLDNDLEIILKITHGIKKQKITANQPQGGHTQTQVLFYFHYPTTDLQGSLRLMEQGVTISTIFTELNDLNAEKIPGQPSTHTHTDKSPVTILRNQACACRWPVAGIYLV